jgi:1-acyl-sn-glycerol-3-phosphate acyltransferase
MTRIAESRSGEDDEVRLLAELCDLMKELHPNAPATPVRLESLLDADLGLDSLAVVELRSRLEEVFGVTLSDRVLETPTPGGWLQAVRSAPGQNRTAATRAVATPTKKAPTEAGNALPLDSNTLLDALAWHADNHPGRIHVSLLYTSEDEAASEVLTYGSLSIEVTNVAGALQEYGLRPGETVGIMLPTSADYFIAFLGVVMAGGIPVPIYPPARPAGLEDHLRRQVHILDNALATILVTVPEARLVARLVRPQVPSLRAVLSVKDLRTAKTSPALRPAVRSDDTALIQYTSGSTGRPKGVVLAHRHLLANIRALGAAAALTPADVFVSWLPLYHDMGLIGAWLTSLYYGIELVVMPPTAFLARPARWLEAVGAHGGTLSASPNFGYELCLRHVSDGDLEALDLSTWRIACNGAEPVSPETIRRFTERFAPCGFRPEVMTPVYGLAEAGVGLTFPPLDRGPMVDAVDRQTLVRSGRAEPAAVDDPRSSRFVACGRPLHGYQVRVVDSSDKELADRHEGRIEFTGPSATPGYFRNEEATRDLRRTQWLDTGDVGYTANGDLYLTGRSKDIIIRAGRNLHPDELEIAVGNLPGARKGCVAVFAFSDASRGTERLVVLAESRLFDSEALAELRRRITALTVDLLGTPPDDVVLAPPGTVLKTSSGKIRRASCRELYEAGEIGHRNSPARWQIARFALGSAAPEIHRAARTIEGLLYAAYAWTITLLVGVPVWLLVTVMPTLRFRWAVLRAAGRIMCHLCGLPMDVTGTVPESGPYVVVANHASFIDGLVLALCLQEPVAFVAGGELATQRVAGPFLRRLGCEFVDQSHPQQRSSEIARITDALRSGRNVAFFPEGSLHRAAGLRSFHLGAFAVAIESGTSIVPVGIRGSRDVVRPGGRFPRRGAIHVTIGQPISSSGKGWQATLNLRDRARAAILSLSGEPELQ